MSPAVRGKVRSRFDMLGVVFLVVLAALAGGSGYAALEFGWFRSPWEMAGWLVAATAFVAAGIGIHNHRPAKNADVYGAAKTASEAEAQAAARGEMKTASLHDQTFLN